MPPSPASRRSLPPTRAAIIAVVVALAYFAVAKLTFFIPIANVPGGMVSIVVWPAAAIAFVGYWRHGWPALIGALAATLALHYSFGHSLSTLKLITAFASMLLPLSARWLLLRTGTAEPFANIAAIARYTIFAALIAPMCNASLSVLSTWLIWWAAEVFAMLLVSPALMTWRDWTLLDRRHWIEIVALIGGILFVFHQLFLTGSWSWAAPLSLLLLPSIYAAMFRFNLGVMAGISLLISMLGIVATSTVNGIHLPSRNDYFYLLGFLAMQALFSIVMCSSLATARRTFNRLIASEERFRAMFEQAAVGIVIHDIHSGQHIANHRLTEMLGYDQAE